MRRQPGVAGLLKQQKTKRAAEAVGEQIQVAKVEDARAQLESFRDVLSDFAQKHRSRINNDPAFRQSFFEMCVTTGVDPLAGGRGTLADVLGIGHFFDDLAVQILTICMQTRDVNGGLLDLEECLTLLKAARAGGGALSAEDVERAVEHLWPLGPGVGIPLHGRKLILSVPDELNADHMCLLKLAGERNGRVTRLELIESFGWSVERTKGVLAHFLREGLCWVDTQEVGGYSYWIPSMALAS